MTPVPLLPTPGLLRKQLLKATSTDTQCHFQAGGVTLYNSVYSPKTSSEDLLVCAIPLN